MEREGSAVLEQRESLLAGADGKRPEAWLVAGLLLLTALSFLLFTRSLDRSIWVDEAWVANSILSEDLGGMFYYEHWLQTNPPLFLVLVRGVTALVGPSEAALRSLAVVLGVASALLLGLLARRMMKPAWALLSVALLLSSREFVQQAQSVKHYAGDVFAALVLLHLSLSYLQSRSARSLQWVLLAYVPLAFLSFAAVFFAPVLLYAACSDSRQRSGEGIVFSPRIGQVGAIVATVLATSGLNWIFFVSRNRNELLHDY
jgi:uncharacterized membrane protein